MSVRVAELLMAIALALLSIAFMVKSTDGLSIWWVPEKGPGSGAWPFWLSVLMLLTCLTIIARWVMRVTPQSRSEEPFMDAHAAQLLGITVAALFLLILGTYYIGIYLSLFAFLFFYLKIFGRHSWTVSVALTAAIPVGVFLLFEYALTIPLPKGGSETLFFPIYKLMYGKGFGIWSYILAMALGAAMLAAQYYPPLGPRPHPAESPMSREVVRVLLASAAMLLLIFGTRYVGIYLSLFLFALFAMKALGRQSWLVTGAAMIAVPLLTYLILELGLGISLPKGATAPLFGA